MKKILFLLLFCSVMAMISDPGNALSLADKSEYMKETPQTLSLNYTLPKLPYTYTALEPFIDAKTMEIHYTKHHQKYVDDLNKTLENYPNLLGKPVEYLLSNVKDIPELIRTAVIDFAGGHLNHSMFWLMMTDNARKQPQGILKTAIDKQFKSFDTFKEQFNKKAKELFGSGWAWLCITPDKKLILVTTKDQDSPISMGLKPILGLDVWEHAYYLKHQNKRIDYIETWWNVVNWDYVEKKYQEGMILL